MTVRSPKRNWRLSPRELQILRRIAQGHTMPEIATELSIGPETVKQHQKSARLKLGATTSAHAVALALANGTLRLDEVAPSGREGTILG